MYVTARLVLTLFTAAALHAFHASPVNVDTSRQTNISDQARFEEWCRFLYDDCGQSTILNILDPSTSATVLPSQCDKSSNLVLFTRLISIANLQQEVNNTSPLTLFIPDDVSMRTSAEDIIRTMKLSHPLVTDDDVISVFTDHFLPQFEEPASVLDAIIRNHMTTTPLPSCQLWITQTWMTLDQQRIFRGGVDLASDNTEYIHPEMSIQHLPVQTVNGIIHRIDRVIMPDLTRFERVLAPSAE